MALCFLLTELCIKYLINLKNLIGTQVTLNSPKDISIKNAHYPVGSNLKLGFSKEKILVYQNQVDIKLTLSKTQFEQALKLNLTFQACSDKICLPPQTIALNP
jgi:DsbC/DsbD-like thiol-disulfide interchange protein